MTQVARSSGFWYDSATRTKFVNRANVPANRTDRVTYFSSQFEFQVWLQLQQFVSVDAISRQHKILILPKNKDFGAINWKCDFYVRSTPMFPLAPTLLIEAKGDWILHDRGYAADFAKNLRLIYEFSRSDFNSLVIVSKKEFKLPGTNIRTVPLEELKTCFKDS